MDKCRNFESELREMFLSVALVKRVFLYDFLCGSFDLDYVLSATWYFFYSPLITRVSLLTTTRTTAFPFDNASSILGPSIFPFRIGVSNPRDPSNRIAPLGSYFLSGIRVLFSSETVCQ